MPRSNRVLIPGAMEALNRLKFEVAAQVGIPNYHGYLGDVPSRINGQVGGNMVRRMIAMAQQQLASGVQAPQLPIDSPTVGAGHLGGSALGHMGGHFGHTAIGSGITHGGWNNNHFGGSPGGHWSQPAAGFAGTSSFGTTPTGTLHGGGLPTAGHHAAPVFA